MRISDLILSAPRRTGLGDVSTNSRLAVCRASGDLPHQEILMKLFFFHWHFLKTYWVGFFFCLLPTLIPDHRCHSVSHLAIVLIAQQRDVETNIQTANSLPFLPFSHPAPCRQLLPSFQSGEPWQPQGQGVEGSGGLSAESRCWSQSCCPRQPWDWRGGSREREEAGRGE